MDSSAEVHESDLIAQLYRQPGFPALVKRFEGARELYYQRFARQLSATTPLDQREVDYQRGRWDGGQWFLDQIRTEAKRFTEGARP